MDPRLPQTTLSPLGHENDQLKLFTQICDDLKDKSYSVQHNALPLGLITLLHDAGCCRLDSKYSSAGIGRSNDHCENKTIRSDSIFWIDDQTEADQEWQKWTAGLQKALNRQLFLGLTFLESHYARYSIGGFYEKHLDAFKGEQNRKISIVLFLNEGWTEKDEGELQLFVGEKECEEIIVKPELGTLVVFASQEVPHEVFKTNCVRNSIAGWYR